MSTPTRPARRYAKEVRIDTSHYRRTHGRDPRGYGAWLFAPAHAANEQTPAGEPLSPHDAGAQLYRTMKSYTGTYAQARARAQRDAAAHATATNSQPITLATLP